MRHLHGLAAALLAFVIGIVISPIHFEVEAMGRGRALDGSGGLSITSYRSSYFVQLSFAHLGHSSPEKANATFDEMIAEAIEVKTVTPKLDEHGNKVGRRAVAMFIDKETDRHFACVFWTQGTIVHAINSSSLMHVLDFEKQNVVD